MTKYFFFFLLSLLSFELYADLENCYQDAAELGFLADEERALNCRKLVQDEPGKIEVISSSGRYHITALKNILFLDTLDIATNAFIKREVLAGDQTDFKEIKKIWFQEKKNRFIVLQAAEVYSVLTFTLEYISNTAPLRHFKSDILNKASQIKLLDDRDELAIMSKSEKTIWFINSDADSVRYKGGNFTPRLLRKISGEEAALIDPIDVAISDTKKEVYVLDTGRILVFDLKSEREVQLRDIFFAPELKDNARGIELAEEDGFILAHLISGEIVKISIQ